MTTYATEPTFLRGPSTAPCWDLLPFSILAVCLLLATVVLAFRVYSEHQEWIRRGIEKKSEGNEKEVGEELLELEAGRRYNIPVEYFRNVEIRVK